MDSLYSFTCEGDAVSSGHPLDCLKYSYSGAFNTTTSYYSYTGDYSTNSYSGKICKSDSNNPECINQTNWCKGDTDPRLQRKECILFEKTSVLIGDVRKTSQFDNVSKGKSYIDVKTFFGPYLGIIGPYFGYIDGKSGDMDAPNEIKSFPPDNVIGENPTTLITAIEVSSFDKLIKRIMGVYYCKVENLIKQSEWNAYNEDYGLIDLTTYQTKPIYSEVGPSKKYVGDGSQFGRQFLLRGSFQDSAICGVYYNIKNNRNVGRTVLNGICFAFRRFYDLNSPTEYIGVLDGEQRTFTEAQLNNWSSFTEARRGEFISQIEFAYTNIEPVDRKISAAILRDALTTAKPEAIAIIGAAYLVILPLAPILLPIIGFAIATGMDLITVRVQPEDIGVKGITQVRMINYNLKNRLYSWIEQTNNLQCCNLLSDQQYDAESIESYVCRANKNFTVKNDFPNSYPNDNCRINILEPYCNSKTLNQDGELNIAGDLCGAVCALNNTNCDTGIKTYCNSGEFIEKDASGIERGEIMKKLKDPICGCMFDDEPSNFLLSFSSSVDDFINKKIFPNFKDQLSKPFRKECTLASCKKSNYKLFDMKKALVDKKCTETELCFGNGFQIPFTSDNNTKVDCKRYMGGKFNCITKPEDGGLQPNITVITDPLKQSCKNIMDKQPDTFKFEPAECELTESWQPRSITEEDKENIVKSGLCYKKPNGVWKYKATKKIKINSTPSGDPNLCPPFERDIDGNIVTDPETGAPLRVTTEIERICPGDPEDYFNEDGTPKETPTSFTNIIIAVGIILFFLFLVLIIKIIKKKKT